MARFDYFVLFAEMRTGSNFLEANIDLYPDLACLGEVFNPHFLAYPDTQELLGFSQADRDANPMALVEKIREQDGIQGFRFFHDHHGAILDDIIADPRCAKIVLTRNPVESYVSWKIAQATGQWKLTNATHHKASQAEFDRDEFEQHLGNLQAFQIELLNSLQKSGQTAFYVAYEDIQDVEIMNGLAAFLGSETRLEGLSKKLKKQNPAPMSEKVANFEEMEASLASLDRFDLTRTPNFEPRRGAVIPTYVAAAEAPLLYMPMRSGPVAQVKEWLSGFGGLEENFTQKTLRQWKRGHKGHRTFTVVRHPVPRAYEAFQRHIVGTGKGAYLEIRKTLSKVYNVPLQLDGPDETWGYEEQRAAFLAFLAFLKMNLDGQTAVRVDAVWASQNAILSGFADFALPDAVVREENMAAELTMLCEMVGVEAPGLPPIALDEIPLTDIYDEEVEAAVRDVYQRDYMAFGYGPYANYAASSVAS
ncbi:MAG: sulfotransferase domain-containing protein [Rhodobacteraceae bacterium]|nr:sulfotransferase domain-containing protein [Paracoccaceae bacterium]